MIILTEIFEINGQNHPVPIYFNQEPASKGVKFKFDPMRDSTFSLYQSTFFSNWAVVWIFNTEACVKYELVIQVLVEVEKTVVRSVRLR